MMKNYKTVHNFLFILAVTLFSLLAGCSKTTIKKAVENERTNIINAEMIDLRRSSNSILDIQSVELLSFKAQPIYALNKISADSSKKGLDSSLIDTLYDRFGNKTEIRSLEDDLNLKCIILKTSISGSKQAMVFGKNGEVKSLPEELSEKALTADSSYIAAAAGIFGLPKIPAANPGTDNQNEKYQPDTALSNAVTTPEYVPVDQTQKMSASNSIDEKNKEKIEFAPKVTTSPVQTAVKEDSTVKIKTDSLWLNNPPPKKRVRSNDFTAEPSNKADNLNEAGLTKTN